MPKNMTVQCLRPGSVSGQQRSFANGQNRIVRFQTNPAPVNREPRVVSPAVFAELQKTCGAEVLWILGIKSEIVPGSAIFHNSTVKRKQAEPKTEPVIQSSSFPEHLLPVSDLIVDVRKEAHREGIATKIIFKNTTSFAEAVRPLTEQILRTLGLAESPFSGLVIQGNNNNMVIARDFYECGKNKNIGTASKTSDGLIFEIIDARLEPPKATHMKRG